MPPRDELKSLLDGFGLYPDTNDHDVLAKAAQAAGVIGRLTVKTSAVLPKASTLKSEVRKHGVLQWDTAAIRVKGKTPLHATNVANWWDRVKGVERYRLGFPLDIVTKGRSVPYLRLPQLVPDPLRQRALSILDTGTWHGKWHWPLRLSVLPDAKGIEFARHLEDISMVKRGLATIHVIGDVDEPYDMLLIPDTLRSELESTIQSLKSLAPGIVAVLGGSPRSLNNKIEDLAKVRRVGAAAATIMVDLPNIDSMAQWTNGLVTEFAHSVPIDEAAWSAGRMIAQAGNVEIPSGIVLGKGSTPLLVSTPDALKTAPLADAITQMIVQTKNCSPDTRVVISPTVNQTLALSLKQMSSVSEVRTSLRQARKRDSSFLRESGGATGIAILKKSIDDATTGADQRFSDLILFSTKGDQAGPRVAPAESLVLGRAYILEIAIRTKRIGIGFEREPRPINGIPRTDCELLVTLTAQHESDGVDIPESVQILDLPKEGDSKKPAKFRFLPKKVPSSKELQLELRVYYRLNLIEHIVLRSHIGERPFITEHRAHLLIQRDVPERYEVDFAKTYQPHQMNIHVTPEGDGYRLTFVIERGASQNEPVRMCAYCPITRDDLTRELERVRDLWLTVLESYGNVLRVASPAEKEVWDRLIEAGRDLWALLFRGEQGGALDAIRQFLEANPLPRSSSVQIVLAATARSFIFPWTLLRDGRKSENEKSAYFWGTEYIIEQRIESMIVPREVPAPSSSPPLSVMLYKRVKESDLQLKLIEAMRAASDGKISCDDAIEGGSEFKKLLADCDSDILYFFCHGYTPFAMDGWIDTFRRWLSKRARKDNSFKTLEKAFNSPAFNEKESWIELTKNTITLRELERETVSLRRRPMVILNMCQSAQILPELTNSFIDFFLRKRARSVLGTECPVPPVFANAFAHELLPQLLSGDEIGSAVLEARRNLAQSHGNPFGLAYVLWGITATKYMPAAIQPRAATDFRSNWRKENP